MTVAAIPLVLMLLGHATSAGGGLAESSDRESCPAETEQGRRVIVNYATTDAYARVRASNGVPSASEAQVRLLADETDSAICQQITAAIQRRNQHGTMGLQPVYYAVGDHYFAVLSLEKRQPPPARAGHVWVSSGHWTPMYVFDRDLNLVASNAM